MFYRPVQHNRYFYKGMEYSRITWGDFRQVVDAFRRKINEWYIVPADRIYKAGLDEAFTLMGITCMLIDSLSQYHRGVTQSGQQTFKDFVKDALPAFHAQLPQPIRLPNGNELKTYSDVLYVGFRCGILHECHAPLYCSLAGLDGKMFDIDTDICTKYNDGNDCPTVRMDPTTIYPAVKKVFENYISDLIKPGPAYNDRRHKFKIKFESSFGIDLSNSTL